MTTKTTYNPIKREIPTTMSIVAFIHCGMCLDEWKADDSLNSRLSPRDYTSYEVGYTALGLQVWCKRHEANVVHVDFQGLRLPGNTGME